MNDLEYIRRGNEIDAFAARFEYIGLTTEVIERFRNYSYQILERLAVYEEALHVKTCEQFTEDFVNADPESDLPILWEDVQRHLHQKAAKANSMRLTRMREKSTKRRRREV